jgi:hypothetical protein
LTLKPRQRMKTLKTKWLLTKRRAVVVAQQRKQGVKAGAGVGPPRRVADE